VVLVALIVLEGADTRAASVQIGRDSKNMGVYLERIEAFVDTHKADPNFTFRVVDAPADLDPPVDLFEGYLDPTAVFTQRRMTEVLFQKYYDDDAPQYVLDGRRSNAASSVPIHR
jgi:hypothetical protein